MGNLHTGGDDFYLKVTKIPTGEIIATIPMEYSNPYGIFNEENRLYLTYRNQLVLVDLQDYFPKETKFS